MSRRTDQHDNLSGIFCFFVQIPRYTEFFLSYDQDVDFDHQVENLVVARWSLITSSSDCYLDLYNILFLWICINQNYSITFFKPYPMRLPKRSS